VFDDFLVMDRVISHAFLGIFDQFEFKNVGTHLNTSSVTYSLLDKKNKIKYTGDKLLNSELVEEFFYSYCPLLCEKYCEIETGPLNKVTSFTFSLSSYNSNDGIPYYNVPSNNFFNAIIYISTDGLGIDLHDGKTKESFKHIDWRKNRAFFYKRTNDSIIGQNTMKNSRILTMSLQNDNL